MLAEKGGKFSTVAVSPHSKVGRDSSFPEMAALRVFRQRDRRFVMAFGPPYVDIVFSA
jgi:hypothetical protein